MDSIAKTVTAAITNWLQVQVLTKAVLKIASMFSPVGALLQALITGWRVYNFIKDKFKQMFELVKTFTDALDAVAKGALQGAMNGVEGVLARLEGVSQSLRWSRNAICANRS